MSPSIELDLEEVLLAQIHEIYSSFHGCIVHNFLNDKGQLFVQRIERKISGSEVVLNCLYIALQVLDL